MNETEMAKFRAIIEARLEALTVQDDLGSLGEATVELDQQVIGRLSRMDALQSQAMAKAGAARRRIERQRLNSALSRLKDDEYGYCEDCGEDIAPARLELDPAAAKCISCARG